MVFATSIRSGQWALAVPTARRIATDRRYGGDRPRVAAPFVQQPGLREQIASRTDAGDAATAACRRPNEGESSRTLHRRRHALAARDQQRGHAAGRTQAMRHQAHARRTAHLAGFGSNQFDRRRPRGDPPGDVKRGDWPAAGVCAAAWLGCASGRQDDGAGSPQHAAPATLARLRDLTAGTRQQRQAAIDRAARRLQSLPL
jgi:hypothetical protein